MLLAGDARILTKQGCESCGVSKLTWSEKPGLRKNACRKRNAGAQLEKLKERWLIWHKSKEVCFFTWEEEEGVNPQQTGGEAEVRGWQLALLFAKAMPLNISACFSWGV